MESVAARGWHSGGSPAAIRFMRVVFILLPSASGVGTPYDDLHWAATLKSVSGFEMYRKAHGRISPRDIVDFLVMDREFPRSIHHCINRADVCVHAITGSPGGSYHYSSERWLGLLRA